MYASFERIANNFCFFNFLHLNFFAFSIRFFLMSTPVHFCRNIFLVHFPVFLKYIYICIFFLHSYFIFFVHSDRKLQREYFDEIIFPISVCFFQYFVFDFHMSPVMLFDKIITLSVSRLLNFFKHSHSYEVAIYRKLGSYLLH